MKAHLEKYDLEKNIARYYRMSVLPNLVGEWTLSREWGRISRGGRVRMDLFRSKAEAENALETLTDAKRKRGYSSV